MRQVIRLLALFLTSALIWTLTAASTVQGQEQQPMPPASDAMDHISEQAQAFITSNTARPLPGPLTPQVVEGMREKQSAAEREILEALQATLKPAIRREPLADVPVVVVTPGNVSPDHDGKVALYIHGGGYALKSALDLTALLMAQQLGLPLYSVEYRLAPEHPFPQGLEDCLAVYGALLQQFKPENVVVFGGSAGGGLALATLLKARQQGLPMPRALGLFSPWADLTRTGDSYFANEGRDPVLLWEGNLEHFAAAYAEGHAPAAPLLSPVNADYDSGFPPTLIVTGTRDLFLSNSVRLARRLQLAGVDAELRIWEAMFHGFDLMPDLPEGEQARREMAGFLLRRLRK